MDRRYQDAQDALRSPNCPFRATDQIPTRRLKANPTFTSIEINETCGDFDVRAHLGLFFLLIDVDRTGSDRSSPALRSGKHKYGFHACGADPRHLRLRPVLVPPCFLILIAKRRDPNDQPLRRNSSRQIH